MTENADEDEYIPVEVMSIKDRISERGVRELDRETEAAARDSRTQLDADDFELEAANVELDEDA
jgi:hypothetical protein